MHLAKTYYPSPSLVLASGILLQSFAGVSCTPSNKLDLPDAMTSGNHPPVANAGADQTAVVDTLVEVDGGESHDPDGDALTFVWSIAAKPTGSNAGVDASSPTGASFRADVAGIYRLSLVVNDGQLDSAPDELNVLVESQGNDSNTGTESAQNETTEHSDATGGSDTHSTTGSMTSTMEHSSGSGSSSTGHSSGTGDSSTASSSETDDENTSYDIRDITLHDRNPSCVHYAGNYFANVTDIKRSVAFTCQVEIVSQGDSCAFVVNEIPNHDFDDESAHFASIVSEQDGRYEVPADPTAAATTTPLNLGLTNAIFLNGVTADLLAAACYDVGSEPLGHEKIGCGPDQINNPWRYDPMSPLNDFGTDAHHAHPQPDGTYHYHGNPLALFDVACESGTEASPVIGFAADGFPVFGPCIIDGSSVRKAQSSYQLKDGGGPREAVGSYTTPQGGTGEVASNNYDGQFRGDWEYKAGSGDLDECNGMTIDGSYGYYITDSYPWVLGCFKGTPDPTFSKMGRRLENALHGHLPKRAPASKAHKHSHRK